MAINITTRKVPLNPDQVRAYLQEQTDSFGCFIDLDRCYEYLYITHNMINETYDIAKQICGTFLNLRDKQDVIEKLKDMGVPGQTFGPNNALNKEIVASILDHPDYAEPARLLASTYQTYRSLFNRESTLRSYATGLDEDEERWGENGHRMVVAHPTWKTLSTSRQATSEPNLQAIAKDFCDLIIAPEGYNLIRCDSNQIEPRITWSYYLRDELIINLITAYGDAYYGLLAYCLMSPEEEQKYRQDFSGYVKMEPDTEKRKQLKVLALAGAYGSTNLDKVDKTLASAFERKITNHPKRAELQAEVETQVEKGNEIFHGYFGTMVIPETTQKYVRGTSGWKGHVIRCGVNNPVQTTASELMNFSVYEAQKILAQAEDSHIAFYKHDEACFYVSDKDKANGILEQLSDITAYNVEGWIPIPCEAEYGILKSKAPTFLT